MNLMGVRVYEGLASTAVGSLQVVDVSKGEVPLPRIFVEKSKLKEIYEIPLIKMKFIQKMQ